MAKTGVVGTAKQIQTKTWMQRKSEEEASPNLVATYRAPSMRWHGVNMNTSAAERDGMLIALHLVKEDARHAHPRRRRYRQQGRKEGEN